MGTHGRNAVTLLVDGKEEHRCHEQNMDGHWAMSDFMEPIFEKGHIPDYNWPSMDNECDECEHERFAHIDYIRKIVYSSANTPEELLERWKEDPEEFHPDLTEEEVIGWKTNIDKLKGEGWRFVFECRSCPKEYNCANSIDATIEEFLEGKDYVQLVSTVQRRLSSMMGFLVGAIRTVWTSREPLMYAFLSHHSDCFALYTMKDGEVISLTGEEHSTEERTKAIEEAVTQSDEERLIEIVRNFLEEK